MRMNIDRAGRGHSKTSSKKGRPGEASCFDPAA
jgi:hypothetical protein